MQESTQKQSQSQKPASSGLTRFNLMTSTPDRKGEPLFTLQHMVDKQAVRQILCKKPETIQTKLMINTPGDESEQEAERAADLVTHQTDSRDEVIPVQRKPATPHPGGTYDVLPSVHDIIRSPGRQLDTGTRQFMESRFNSDFGDVHIHTDAQAAESAAAIQARAYTHGRDIVFNTGEYAPEAENGKHLLAHELTHVVQQQHGFSPVVQCFRVTAVRDVPSLVIEDWSTGRVPGKWSQLHRKMEQRDLRITEQLALTSSGSPAFAILTNLQSRWPSFRTSLADTNFNPVSGRLPSQAAIDTAHNDEETDMHSLTGSRNRIVRAVIREFLNALDDYLADRATLTAEQTEYHRFDDLFNHADVNTLLAANTHVRFTNADVKAFVDQETADLTNTRVHGITTTRPGIQTEHANLHGFIGLGQHSAVARDEGIAWAARCGVTIPARPDPRRIPAQSIKLSAAYLGQMTAYVMHALPMTKPAGDELKKMVFASYNGGQANVAAAARSFLGGRTAAYTWRDIMNQPTISDQMRNYVLEIVGRLS